MTLPTRTDLRARARALGDDSDGVLSRRELYAEGVPRWLVRAELRVGRWQPVGRQAVAVHNGPLPRRARWRAALAHAGGSAALDGVTSLQAAGVEGLSDETIHLVVPKGWRRVPVAGARVHESRRYQEVDIVPVGLRRTRTPVAAVHAALWSRTGKQAALVLLLPVQQRLVTPAQLGEALIVVRRHRFRALLLDVLSDLAGGAQSLGELDVARAVRRRGLPEPVRQAVRERPSGRQYLDADFAEYGVALEVDGGQHDLPRQRLDDLLRDLLLMSEGRVVVRLPLLLWRLDEVAVLDALEVLFRARGWARPAA